MKMFIKKDNVIVYKDVELTKEDIETLYKMIKISNLKKVVK
jgi:hypothetical protein